MAWWIVMRRVIYRCTDNREFRLRLCSRFKTVEAPIYRTVASDVLQLAKGFQLPSSFTHLDLDRGCFGSLILFVSCLGPVLAMHAWKSSFQSGR